MQHDEPLHTTDHDQDVSVFGELLVTQPGCAFVFGGAVVVLVMAGVFLLVMGLIDSVIGYM